MSAEGDAINLVCDVLDMMLPTAPALTVGEAQTEINQARALVSSGGGGNGGSAPLDGLTLSDPSTIGWDDGTGTDTISVSVAGSFGSLVSSVQGFFQWIVNAGQVAILSAAGLQLQGGIMPGFTGGADGTRPGEIQWNGTNLVVWTGSQWLTVSAT